MPEGGVVCVQGVQLVLCLRDKIGLAGENLADGADSGRDTLDAVDDCIVIVAENNVAVLAHDFDHESLMAEVAHLVHMLDLDMDDTLQTRLGNIRDAPIL